MTLRTFRARLWGSLTRRQHEAPLSEEIETHLSLLAADFEAQGLTPDAARAAARREFGGIEVMKDSARDERGFPLLASIGQDIRYALRQLRAAPIFSAAAVLTLAVGIGGTIAMFGIFDAVLMRPLAYADSERLHVIHEIVPRFNRIAPLLPVNALHFEQWQRSASSFESIALVGALRMNLTGNGEPEQVPAARVSPVLFSILGVTPALGRLLRQDEDQPGHDRSVVLDHDFWVQRFGGAPDAIGRTIRLDGAPFEIVGVLPAGFRFPKISQIYPLTVGYEKPRVWKPFALQPSERAELGDFNYSAIGRLRRGVTAAAAEAEIDALQAELGRTAAPGGIELHASVVPLRAQIGGRARLGLQLLLAAIGVVLLIVCVNVTNLLLSKSLARSREMGIRLALGASAGRICRQVFTETLVLCAIGGAVGTAIAASALAIAPALLPADLPRADEIALNGRALALGFAASLGCALIIGLLPAWRHVRIDLVRTIKASRGAAASANLRGALSLLLSAEVALSVVCLVAAGLMLRSFNNLLTADRGFAASDVVVVDVNLPRERYPDLRARTAFVDMALERIGNVAGLRGGAVTSLLPLRGQGSNNVLGIEGSGVPLIEGPVADVRNVSPGFFTTLGIPLRAGRLFERRDSGERVALVSELTAKQLWHGDSPIGRRFRTGSDTAPLIEVIGVVGDVRAVSLGQPPTLTVYVPFWQTTGSAISIVAAPAGDRHVAEQQIRQAIRAVDPELPLPPVQAIEQIVESSLSQPVFQLRLLAIFSGIAVLLTAIGVFGVTAFSVAQRVGELGVRLALGARPTALLHQVMLQELRAVAFGLFVGVPVSIGVAYWIRSLLYGMEPYDIGAQFAAAAILIATGALAAWLPARRTTRLQPMSTLRCE